MTVAPNLRMLHFTVRMHFMVVVPPPGGLHVLNKDHSKITKPGLQTKLWPKYGAFKLQTLSLFKTTDL